MNDQQKFLQILAASFLVCAVFGVLVGITTLTGDASPQAPEATSTMPPPGIEFPGIAHADTVSDTKTVIPDTTGAAGHGHFMQAVNKSVALYRKDGILIDMTDFNTFWVDAATGTNCDGVSGFHNGQPYLIYDHMAGRWVVVDVAYDPALIDTGPYNLCIAVSNSLMTPMTPVAVPGEYFSGTYWYYYSLEITENNLHFYPDMPKLGLWPDGYYLSIDLMDIENNGAVWSPHGVKVYALNRSDLMNGVDDFVSIDFYLMEEKGYKHLVPSNLLGSPPAAGTPNYFAAMDTGKLYIWEFNVDWNNPSSSTFGMDNGIPQEPNIALNTGINDLPTGSIIPQYGVTQKVEVHGDRLMSPLQYRILEGKASLWATHTIEDPYHDGRIGLRWYQIQLFDDADPDFVQSGIYSPDDAYRWLGSLATDRTGNMALGFSISSSTMNPAIKYVGRLHNDPTGELPQYENWLTRSELPAPFNGSQDDGNSIPDDGPWGRQSQMSIDPMDECIFWYTNMYYETTGMEWSTRIGWFSFPQCRSGVTTRISLHTNGTQGNETSGLDRYAYEMYQVGVSGTGRYVAFSSDASNLVDDDTNGHRDVFLRDRDVDGDGVYDEPGAVSTTMISMASDGSQTNGDSWEVSISYNGQYIAYSSDAINIVPNDNNNVRDIFLYNRVTKTTTRVSVANHSSVAGNNTSDQPFISGNGAYVAFRSAADNLVAGDNNNATDVFVHDIIDGTTERVSVATGDVEANDASYSPTLSETGRYVAFGSVATNLDTDTDTLRDVFVHDRDAGTTTIVSVTTSGEKGDNDSYTPFISGNGDFIVFSSDATNLAEVTPDTNGYADIYVRNLIELETARVSISFFGTQSLGGDSFSPSISRDGRYISFASEAYNLDVTLPDLNDRRDVFIHDRQLALAGVYEMGKTSRISLGYEGDESNGWSFAPVVAPYGKHVAYVSEASNLVADDTNGKWDVFAYDSERTIPIFLSIPTNILGSVGAIVTVPVFFSGSNATIDTTTFSIDFNEECLSFDNTDGNGDGIPDAIRFLLSTDFYTAAQYTASDTDGEIDIDIWDRELPRTVITDGEIMNIDFIVRGTCSEALDPGSSARVGFSNDPSPSFSSYGMSVNGSALDGSVKIIAGLHSGKAYLPLIIQDFPPTPTPTPEVTYTPTATLPPGSTPTQTSTPTPTVTPTAPPCSDYIINGDFEDADDKENDGDGWEILPTFYSARFSTANAHSPERALLTGILDSAQNTNSYSSGYQVVSLPGNATKAQLTFWNYPLSDEVFLQRLTSTLWMQIAGVSPNETQGFDIQYVAIEDLSLGTDAEIVFWQVSNSKNWEEVSINLKEHAGHVIRIWFATYNDGVDGVSAMYVDDVTLEVCR